MIRAIVGWLKAAVRSRRHVHAYQAGITSSEGKIVWIGTSFCAICGKYAERMEAKR